ncbi:MAG: PEP-CTERM sorting domain-containing protein [Desulfobacula sp.]|uniref:PEP-CTERM sorting domain-containing protein n=1 Tax=Desulfobacula sp. TaxID=2593537 RepID=UPI0025C3D58E|nr:PEP-CTERM sorting domain-containing protein [Desulfobacula sp.]MCD4719828.1 PEP-CTERM sorting domain-containing protein [Desulfobacula sp.]
MKNKILYLIIILLVTVVYTGSAMATWSFNITTDYALGDAQAVFDLNFLTDEEITIEAYAFEFKFDKDELSYVSSTNTPTEGLYSQFLGPFSADQENGTLDGFNAASFSSSVLAPANYLLGTFTFDVTNSVKDGVTDFNFDYTDSMFGFGVNGIDWGADNTKALPHFTDIGAVPVPSAVWLLGSGLMGLLYFRRKKA